MSNTRTPRGQRRAPAYPFTYQPELAPSWLHHAATLGGFSSVHPTSAFSYLELGCGQGFSSLLHAACYPQSTFHAVDCDEDAIAGLRALARQLGIANLNTHVSTVETFPVSLGNFDFIAAHGVYSWVCEDTRAAIRALLATRLAPHGVAYVSYNCMPGWAAEIPLRRLLRESDVLAAGSYDLSRLAYFRFNPVAARALANLGSQPAGYLAQEYLSPDWDALWSVDVIDEMAAAGLAHAGSATLRDFYPELLVDDVIRGTIDALPHPRMKTLAMDFALNRTLRRDVFVRADAARPAPARDLGQLVVGRMPDLAEIDDGIMMPRGRIRFDAGFIAALRTFAAQRPFCLAEAVEALDRGDCGGVERNLLWLIAAGVLTPAAHRRNANVARDTELATAWRRAIASGAIPDWLPDRALGRGVPR